MTQEFSVVIDESLQGKQKLIFEAVLKMQNGKTLYDQGKLEFMNLTGAGPTPKKERKKRKIKRAKVPGVRKLSAAKKAALTRANKVSTFRMDKSSDEELGNKFLEIVRTIGSATINYLGRKTKVGERRTSRVVGVLIQKEKLEWAAEGTRRYLRIPLKKVNGTHLESKEKAPTGRPAIDITDEKFLSKAKKVFQSNKSITRGTFIAEMDMSWKPGTRLLDYLEKNAVVHAVEKKNPNSNKVTTYYELN